MPEEIESGVDEVAAAPEIEQQPTNVETEAAKADSAGSKSEKPKGSKDENMERMRQSLDDLKRKNAEMAAALEQLRAPVKVAEPEVDELASLGGDDFVNKSQAEKLIERKVAQRVEAALKAMRVENREGLFAATTSDYKQVVTQENFDALFQDVPELRPVMAKAYELAQRGEDIDPVALSYKLLKKFGGGSATGESEMAKRNAEALAKNVGKPQSANAVKSSALSEAHKFINSPSKDEKARIFKETQEAARARR
jgi:hypothetical protein